MATNISATIVTGGVSQVLAPQSDGRRGYMIHNLSDGDLWVNDVGGLASAARPSLRIPAGYVWETPEGYLPVSRISIFGVTTGQSFTAREW